MTDRFANISPQFQILTVPGLYSSGPEHWQTRWERLHPAWHRVEQKDWSRPSLYLWAERVGESVSNALRGAAGGVILVAHSFGCLASLRYALEMPEGIAGILLVAPADPDKFGVGPLLPQSRLPFPTVLAASRNDPWVPQRAAFSWGALWGSETVDLGAVGHVNADSGLGDWPAGLALVERVAQRAEAAVSGAASQEIDTWEPGMFSLASYA